jgi:centrosomal protein CEP164
MFSSNYDLLSTSFNKQVSSKGTAALNNQSIINRAIEIGMDPLKDQKLFWIAEQSLKAKLPEEWIECQTDEGQVYFYNLRNEDSTWEHPSLDHYRGLYEKVKKQQTESQSSNKKITNLPEIGTKDPQNQSPRAAVGAVGLAAVALGTAESVSSPVTPSATPAAPGGGRLLNGGGSGIVAASALKQKKDAERLGGDASFWRTRFELMEAEVTSVALPPSLSPSC